MVEEGGEEVAQEVVGRWGQMLRDVAVPQPPADDVAVLGLHQRVVVRAPGPGLRELLDVQLVQHRRDPVVDVLRPVVGMEGQDAEGERADERFEHGDHEVLGDPGNGRKLLELRHFVDHVDHVGPLLAAQVAAVDGVNAYETRPALRPGSAPLADRRYRPPGRPERGPGTPVRPATPQVVDVAVRNPRQALEALVAEDMVLAPQDPLDRRSGGLAEGLVHLGQQHRVGGRVHRREGPGGRTQPVVADVARAALLRDQPAQLGVRVAGDLGKELPHPALPSPRQAEVVPEPDERPFNERVGRLPVVGGDVRRLVPAEEGADVVERPNPFGAECHNHAPMICSHPGSCSLPVGNRLPAHAHFSLDNAPEEAGHRHRQPAGRGPRGTAGQRVERLLSPARVSSDRGVGGGDGRHPGPAAARGAGPHGGRRAGVRAGGAGAGGAASVREGRGALRRGIIPASR